SGTFVCAICLGSHPNVTGCRSPTLWNGSPARCHRDGKGRILNPQGGEICIDFQLLRGCKGGFRNGQKHLHECSGCGLSSHGASNCPYRSKL
ncbi:hypothetical protein DFH07DRAFT_740798, partial [Mycena maculata]